MQSEMRDSGETQKKDKLEKIAIPKESAKQQH
jgi:hypothetical protein